MQFSEFFEHVFKRTDQDCSLHVLEVVCMPYHAYTTMCTTVYGCCARVTLCVRNSQICCLEAYKFYLLI